MPKPSDRIKNILCDTSGSVVHPGITAEEGREIKETIREIEEMELFVYDTQRFASSLIKLLDMFRWDWRLK
jgi:hypothetical protein